MAEFVGGRYAWWTCHCYKRRGLVPNRKDCLTAAKQFQRHQTLLYLTQIHSSLSLLHTHSYSQFHSLPAPHSNLAFRELPLLPEEVHGHAGNLEGNPNTPENKPCQRILCVTTRPFKSLNAAVEDFFWWVLNGGERGYPSWTVKPVPKLHTLKSDFLKSTCCVGRREALFPPYSC